MQTTLRTTFFLIPLHPMIPISLCVLLGIWWQSFGFNFYVSFFMWFCIIIGGLFFLLEKPWLSKIILGATSFLIGATSYQYHCNHYHVWCEKITNKVVNLNLIIQDITENQHPFLKYTATGSIHSITTQEGMILAKTGKNILIYSPKKLDIHVGDHIKLSNVLIKNVSHSPLKTYFMKENIGGTIMSNNLDITVLDHPNMSIMRWIAELKDSLRNRLKQKLSLRTFNIFSLLFLGNKIIKKQSLNALRQYYKLWGISHYLARSGLHLVIFIIIWELLLRFLPLPFSIKQCFLVLITCCYALLSWSSISFLRSFLLFIFYKIGIVAHTYINPLHALACITLFLTLLNPMCPFFLDFQLSFGVTFLLSWIAQVQAQQNRHLYQTLD